MKDRGFDLAVAVALAAAAWALFAPTLDQGFIPFDDDIYVRNNPNLAATARAADLAWTLRPYESNWIPLTWLSYSADHALGGMEARVYHRSNVALHAAATALLFLALCALTGERWRSLCVAAIFGLHPLRVESVAWVAERKDVLSGVFAMATLWAWAGYVRARSRDPRGAVARGAYVGACLAFGLGLLAKPMLVTLPLVLLALDFWPLRRSEARSWRSLLLEKLPFLALSLASGVMTLVAQHEAGAVARLEQLSFGARLGNALQSLWIYTGQSLWPTRLAIFYPHPGDGISWAWSALAAAGLALVAFLAQRKLRTQPQLAVGGFWFVVMLLPVIGIIQVGVQGHADRYTYLPQIGLALALVWSLPDPSRLSTPTRALAAALGLALCLLMFWQTRVQLTYWQSGVHLFERALAVSGSHAKIHQGLGLALHAEGRDDEALAQFRQASKRAPHWARPLAAVGGLLTQQGDYEGAHRAYSRAIALEPDSAVLRLGFARSLMDAGQYAAALQHLVRIEDAMAPWNRADYYSHLGVVHLELGDDAKAVAAFERALALRPNDPNALTNLATAKQRGGDLAGAVALHRRALAIDPELASAHANLAAALAERGERDAATQHFERAIALGVDGTSYHLMLARIYEDAGQRGEAIRVLRGALEQDSESVEVRNNLVWNVSKWPESTKAERQEALLMVRVLNVETRNRNPVVLDTVAAAFVANEDYAKALSAANRAVLHAERQEMTELLPELEAHRDEIRARVEQAGPLGRPNRFGVRRGAR